MRNKLLLGIFLCSFQVIANASAVIGTVIFTADQVTAEQNHVKRTLARGAALYAGDVIITSDKSQAKIKYNNGTLVSIEPNSNYQVSATSTKANGAFDATLNKGSIEYKSTGKKKQGTLNTPVVALAILGTEFGATIELLGGGKYEASFSVTSGSVRVGPRGPILTRGDKASISKGGKIRVGAVQATLKTKDTIPLADITTVSNNLTATTANVSTLVAPPLATIEIGCFP
jgi:hypothetical protein